MRIKKGRSTTKINSFMYKVKQYINILNEKDEHNKIMFLVDVLCNLLYIYNQDFIDEDLEQIVLSINDKFSKTNLRKEDLDSNTILYYDSFGLDTRGLALIYLKALSDLKYKIIYVTKERARNNQPVLHKNVNIEQFTFIYLPDYQDYDLEFCSIVKVFEQYKPKQSFLYSTPYDVSAIMAFEHFDGIIERFQINLTDHAFWLGKYAFDYCIEFRDYGAKISREYRGIITEKIVKLPYYPYINYQMDFLGFPFQKDNKFILFSGGAIYKTFGEGNLYYKIVGKLLKENDNVVFLYAGSGDDSKLQELETDYKGRVYHIEERKDLYQLMCNIDLYLNTYPLLGALMTQYAVAAGKIPLTLKHGNDGDGVLINQENIGIEFETEQELLIEANKLIHNEEYRHNKENVVKKSLITERQFQEELQNLLHDKKNDFQIDDKELDINMLRKIYKERFNYKQSFVDILKNKKYFLFYIKHPLFFSKILMYAIFTNSVDEN